MVEEAGFLSSTLAHSGTYREMSGWMARVFASAGLATDWAWCLPSLFVSAGFRDVVADADVPFYEPRNLPRYLQSNRQ